MRLHWLILTICLFVPSIGQCEYYPELDTLKTPLGTVRVIESIHNLPINQSLAVNGKIVYRSAMGIGIYSKFKVTDGIAVLFGENQGGNDWVWILSFLILRPNQKPTVITTKNFFSADATLEAQQKGNDITVDLGFEAKKRKTALLHAGEVLIDLSPMAHPIPVNEESCGRLHKYSANECIESGKRDKSRCEEERNYFGDSTATMTDITIFENHPGFSKAALGEACVSECETGDAIPYDQFKNSVCSITN